MMADFRALCAELTEFVARLTKHYYEPAELLTRARAALADEPAVPEGREPTRDELWELWLRLDNEMPDKPAAVAELWEHARVHTRALCGNPAPAPPVDGEVAELTGQPIEAANGAAAMGWDQHAQRILRAAELLQRQALVSVPVSERLPGPEDCDEQGRCWAGTKASVDTSGDRDIDLPPSWELREVCAQDDAWLPAHALPLPEVGE